MPLAKLSSKHQIVVPREARQALDLRAGDRLLVVVRGQTVILMRKPKSYSRAITGLAGDSYPPEYLDSERAGWS
jgi:AbrB family looped-hinge helix DNA binding protein